MLWSFWGTDFLRVLGYRCSFARFEVAMVDYSMAGHQTVNMTFFWCSSGIGKGCEAWLMSNCHFLSRYGREMGGPYSVEEPSTTPHRDDFFATHSIRATSICRVSSTSKSSWDARKQWSWFNRIYMQVRTFLSVLSSTRSFDILSSRAA